MGKTAFLLLYFHFLWRWKYGNAELLLIHTGVLRNVSEAVLVNTQILSCSENEKHVLLRMLLLFFSPSLSRALVPSTLCSNKLQIERRLAFFTGLVAVKALTQSSQTVVFSEILDKCFVVYIYFSQTSFEQGMHHVRNRPGVLPVTQTALGLDGTRHS